MATTQTAQAQDEERDPAEVLSHVVKRMLRQEGGNVEVARVTYRISDYVDISPEEASDLLDEGVQNGTYTITTTTDGNRVITSASAIGPEPQIVSQAFGSGNSTDFTVVESVTEDIATALERAGYTSYKELADASPDSLADELDPHLDAVAEEVDFERITYVTETYAEALADAGYETFRDLATATPDDIVAVATTMTAAEAENIIEVATKQATLIDESRAATIVESAAEHISIGVHRARAAHTAHLKRADDTGRGTAEIRDLDDSIEPVGDPIHLSTPGLEKDDPEAMYVSDIGVNANDKGPKGNMTSGTILKRQLWRIVDLHCRCS